MESVFNFDEEVKFDVLEIARMFQTSKYSDDYRKKEASSKGGFACRDKQLVSKLRSAGKEIIWRIGKQILNGKFNLVTIAFPIKCAAPYTMLEAM